VRRCLVCAMQLSASAVAVSTLGAITSVRPLPLPELVNTVTSSAIITIWRVIVVSDGDMTDIVLSLEINGQPWMHVRVSA